MGTERKGAKVPRLGHLLPGENLGLLNGRSVGLAELGTNFVGLLFCKVYCTWEYTYEELCWEMGSCFLIVSCACLSPRSTSNPSTHIYC